MMNANEAKKMTNEVREAEMQKARDAARELCENVIGKRIECAAQNGYNTTYHAYDKYIYDEKLTEAVKQYLEGKGYKIYRQSARVIAIKW